MNFKNRAKAEPIKGSLISKGLISVKIYYIYL
jgi:hypothetical protein